MTSDRYHISTLDIPDTRVLFTWGETEFAGLMKIKKNGDRRYRMIMNNGHKKDLPRHATPHLWRPEYEPVWPHDLPEPAWTMPERENEEPQDDVVDELEEEYTGPLGKPKTPPKSIEVCEQRIIRAWRTMCHPGVVKKDLQTKLTFYPEDFLIASEVKKQDVFKGRANLSLSDLDDFDFGVPDPSIEAIGVFQPTARDISDWDYVMGWIANIDRQTKAIFTRRFAVPRSSWSKISRELRGTKRMLSYKYKNEIEKAYWRANGA